MHRASPLRSHRQSAAARAANRLRCGKSGCRCAHRAALAGPLVEPIRGYPCHASPLGAFVPHSVAKPAESLVVMVLPLRAPIPPAIVFVSSIQPASPLARSRFVQAPLTHTIINSRDNGAWFFAVSRDIIFVLPVPSRMCAGVPPVAYLSVVSFAHARTAPCAGAFPAPPVISLALAFDMKNIRRARAATTAW